MFVVEVEVYLKVEFSGSRVPCLTKGVPEPDSIHS
jgi:hypothetical protein